MRFADLFEALIAKPVEGIDPISRKPVTNWRIMQGDQVLSVIGGRFASTAAEALARYDRRSAMPTIVPDLPAKATPKMPRIVTSNFQIVTDTISSSDDPDDFYYHVTSRPKTVLRSGLRPNQRAAMNDGFYRNYSVGKVFFCDRPGVPYWRARIADHLEQQFDNPPKLYTVRFPKELAKSAQPDQLGTRDSHEGAFYSTAPIK